MSSNAEKVRVIIAEQLGVSVQQAHDDANFFDDLGADSLDVVEVLMSIEEEFEIEIPDEDAEKIFTVIDAINYVNDHL